MRSKLLRFIIATVVVLALSATTYSAIVQWKTQSTASNVSLWNLDGWLISLACVLYGFGIAVSFLVLRQALLALQCPAPWHMILAAQALGHVGKYVPGKAMVVILRVGALAPAGVPAVSATISVFVETLSMLAVGSALACSVVLLIPLPTWIRAAAVLMALAATIPTLPPILSRITSRLTKSEVRLPGATGWILFFVAWCGSTVAWLLIGASFTAVLLSLPHSDPWPPIAQLYWIATAAIGLAFSIGFVSLLPGGAGVRELVLTSMLAPAIGTPRALVASIVLRLMFIAVESILAFAASWWLKTQRQKSN